MKAIVGQSVIAGSAPDGARRRARCRGYQGIITKIDGEFITVRFGVRVTRQYHESNLSFLEPNMEIKINDKTEINACELTLAFHDLLESVLEKIENDEQVDLMVESKNKTVEIFRDKRR